MTGPPAKTLYLIRHGITDWNVQRKMQGHTNIPLNDLGRRQAEALKSFLQTHPVEKIFSSDLDRAYQTAKISSQCEDIIQCTRLREVCLGEIEGQTEQEVISRFGQPSWEDWISLASQANFCFPGGETHQESVARFKTRLEEIFENYEFNKAAVYTHGLIIRRLGHHLCPKLEELIEVPNCGVFELHWNPKQAAEKLHFAGLIFHPGL